jgi:hypothetical protein
VGLAGRTDGGIGRQDRGLSWQVGQRVELAGQEGNTLKGALEDLYTRMMAVIQ